MNTTQSTLEGYQPQPLSTFSSFWNIDTCKQDNASTDHNRRGVRRIPITDATEKSEPNTPQEIKSDIEPHPLSPASINNDEQEEENVREETPSAEEAQNELLDTEDMSQFSQLLKEFKPHLARGADMGRIFEHAQMLRDEYFCRETRKNGLEIISLSGEGNRCWVRAVWTVILSEFALQGSEHRQQLLSNLFDHLPENMHRRLYNIFKESYTCVREDLGRYGCEFCDAEIVVKSLVNLLNYESCTICKALEVISIEILRRAGYTDATDVLEYNDIGMGSADMMDIIWKAAGVDTFVVHTGVPDTLDSATAPVYTALHVGTTAKPSQPLSPNTNTTDHVESDGASDTTNLMNQYYWLYQGKLYNFDDLSDFVPSEGAQTSELPVVSVVDHMNCHFNILVNP